VGINNYKGGYMPQKEVETKDGNKKLVVADSQADLDEAVKVAQKDAAPVYPNINHPVAKGHDLVAVGSDVSKVLVDGTGAHNSPMDAVNADGSENGDPSVRAAGMDEPAYKEVPSGNQDSQDPRFASDAEVKEAKKDAEPANEVQPEPAKDKKSSK
jgi:hypothetical protein